MRKRALDPVVELVAQRLERSTFAPLGSVREEVLGIVKEIDVHLLDPQPPKRPPELVGEKLWVDAVPASLGVLHHLREGRAALLARPRRRKRLPLHVADLGDDDELLALLACEYVSDAAHRRLQGRLRAGAGACDGAD